MADIKIISMPGEANALVHETSPYLLQHAYNPVKWQSWNEKALRQAKDENKLLIISVGYSACHWCHVMEHESFEDQQVAALMNKFFIPVKVDREERPDIDQVYMQVAYLSSGQGGWPLNVIALPDGRPVYGGTYFPKNNWLKILEYFASLHQNEPGKLQAQAANFEEGIRSINTIPGIENDEQPQWLDALSAGTNALHNNIDWAWGGKKGAPKFMMPNIWEYLLTRHHLIGEEKTLNAVEVTLEKIGLGGLYDHLGGGFARYSTDMYWKVPHFEKMLYDNAQLVSLYAHAYQVRSNEFYKRVILQTIDFAEKEWRSPEGGFYSAYDADSEGVEGKYYTWTEREIDDLLGNESENFKTVYTISKSGNWEHGNNILHRVWDDTTTADKLNMTLTEFYSWLDVQREKLAVKRSQRKKPLLDNKQLAGWNALMITAYCDAYKALGDESILQGAKRTAAFISEHLLRDNKLYRNYCRGKATISAFLDDYSLLIEAFISLYQVTFDEQWISKAKDMCDYVMENFQSRDNPLLYYTSATDSELISRPRETSDNVISSSNSVMAHNLWQLGWIYDKEEWRQKAVDMCAVFINDMTANIAYFSNWSRLALKIFHEPVQLVLLGTAANAWRAELEREFNPNTIWLGNTGNSTEIPLLKEKETLDGKTTAYICRGKTCSLPISSLEELKLELQK